MTLLAPRTAPDGTTFRDLDHDGVMAPFEDPRRTPEERVDDLLPRLSLAEKGGPCSGWRSPSSSSPCGSPG